MVPTVKCVPLDQVLDNYNAIQVILQITAAITFIAGAVAIFPTLVGGGPAVVVPAASTVIGGCIAAIATLTRFRNYEFNNKLACIDGVRCAMGQVISLEQCGDGDKALNLLLAPVYAPALTPGSVIEVGEHLLPLRLENSTGPNEYPNYIQPKELVYNQGNLASRNWTNFPLANGTIPANVDWLPMFHSEIVGSFLNDWTLALIAWLTAVIAAAGVLVTAETAVGAATVAAGAAATLLSVALIVLVILLVILFLFEGGGNAPAQSLGNSQGTVPPQQVPGPDGLVDTDPTGYAVATADLVMLAGTHVFDTGHHLDPTTFWDQNGQHTVTGACWHELHPIIAITKVDSDSYSSAPGKDGSLKYFDRWCIPLKNWAEGLAESDQAASALEHPAIG